MKQAHGFPAILGALGGGALPGGSASRPALLTNALSQALLGISATGPAPLAYTTVLVATLGATAVFLAARASLAGLFCRCRTTLSTDRAVLAATPSPICCAAPHPNSPILESMRILLEASADPDTTGTIKRLMSLPWQSGPREK
jgi:hypothetical protein